MSHSASAAHYVNDAAHPTVQITSLTVTDPGVTTEALRWSTGVRGPAVPASELEGADLTAYVTQALTIGAHAITAAGGVQDTFNLEQLVEDVARRTSDSTTRAAAATNTAVGDATRAITEASASATKTLTEAGVQARKAFADSVSEAQKDLRAQITVLLGGDNPELLTRLRPLLDTFGAGVTKRSDEQVEKMFEKATRALNPDDPTSPLAKHRLQLESQHRLLTAQVATQHEQLSAVISDLATAVKASTAAREAVDATTRITPLKGATFEERIHAAVAALAVGFGDEYVRSGTTVGRIPNCKKGDGLLVVDGGRARVVLEAHDGARHRRWTEYLDEAERNRGAQASIGVVPTPGQNDGQTIRVIAPRRVIVAVEGDDSAALLRSVCLLMRNQALASVSTESTVALATAKERLNEAMDLLPKIETIRRSAGTIRISADTIDQEGASLRTALGRLLSQAQSALAGTVAGRDESLPTPLAADVA